MKTLTAKKQTAGNNAILASIKRKMNAPIFKGATAAMNGGGEMACRAYMGQFFNDQARERCLASFGFAAVATPAPERKTFTIRPNRENQNYDIIGLDGQAVDSEETHDGALRLAFEYQTELDSQN